MTEPNAELNRRDIFRLLVEAQDAGESVEDSRNRIAVKFEITLEELFGIEQEGRVGNWPPL